MRSHCNLETTSLHPPFSSLLLVHTEVVTTTCNLHRSPLHLWASRALRSPRAPVTAHLFSDMEAGFGDMFMKEPSVGERQRMDVPHDGFSGRRNATCAEIRKKRNVRVTRFAGCFDCAWKRKIQLQVPSARGCLKSKV